ncbi:DNA ligase 6 [Linum grandiflorum]
MNSFLEDAWRCSCEGIMVKTLDEDAGYSPSKRADSWLKVKRDYVEGLGDSLDLVPIGAWHGNGRKAGWYSPFLMACYNYDTEEYQSVCRVMSGFSDTFYKEMKEFFSGDRILSKKPPYYRTGEVPDMWFSAEIVWEIRGADLTLSPVHQAAVGLVHESRGISIRFPRFVRSVTDMKPEECSSASDVAQMFNAQTRKMGSTDGD